ncbi:AAA+ family ATPase [Actibacterium sp. D379-3]
MKRIAALGLLALLMTPPAHAQEAMPDLPQNEGPKAGADDDISEGFDLLGEGAKRLFRGLTDSMEPALRELMGLIDDIDAYEMPERLPNGDIIIRRKLPMPEPVPEGEIEI